MAIGTNIGLRPTTAVTEDFGGIVQQGVALMQAEKERQRLEEERKRKQQQEFEDRYGIEEDLYFLEDTEFRTVNDATIEALSKYRDRYYDVYTELKKDPNNDDLKKRLGAITNSVKRLRAAHDKFLKLGQEGLQMIAEDRMSGVDEENWRQQLEAFDEGRLRVRLDEKDNMQFLFYDKDGNLQQVVPYDELIRGSLIERVDVNEEVEGMLKLIGRDKFDSVTGRFIETADVWGRDQELQARTLIRQNLASDAVMADLLNQATNGASKKRTDFTAADRQTVENYLVNSVKNAYSEARTLRERKSPRQLSSSEKNKPSTDKLVVQRDQEDGGALMRDNKVVITYADGIQIDPTEQGAIYNEIRVNNKGQLELRGNKKVKLKGKQAEEAEKAIDSGIGNFRYLRIPNSSGGYTYYEEREAPPNRNETDIAKFADKIGAGSIPQLQSIINQKLVEEFGQENVDAFYRGEIKNAPVDGQAAEPENNPIKYQGMSLEELDAVDWREMQGEELKEYFAARAAAKNQ
jgi:hypothetical protein